MTLQVRQVETSCCCAVLTAQLCPTLCNPMNAARQAPLSMGFSRRDYWSGLPLPPPGDLPLSRCWQADSLPLNRRVALTTCVFLENSIRIRCFSFSWLVFELLLSHSHVCLTLNDDLLFHNMHVMRLHHHNLTM